MYILLIGRKNCRYSRKIRFFLKKKVKKLDFLESSKRGEKIKTNISKNKYDFIFCFRSLLILKENFLKGVKISAINFHPGMPNYRGTGCLNYALYDNSKYYGCTAHIIENNDIDNGSIIDFRKFKIGKKDTLDKLLNRTHQEMYVQATYVIKKLLKNADNLNKMKEKNKKITWSGKIKKKSDLDKFYRIKINSTKKEFEKKIRATYCKNFKPYLIIHGKKFVLN